MKLKELIREETEISFTIIQANEQGHEEVIEITSAEAPHPEMDNALAALPPIIKRVEELAGTEGITPYGLTVSYSKHGTRTAVLKFRKKSGITGKTYKRKTVAIQIDDPADEEDGERNVEDSEKTMIETLINEGKRYADGERQQILLPLDNPEAEPKDGKGQGELEIGDDDEDDSDE